jgi:hypothetical protein
MGFQRVAFFHTPPLKSARHAPALFGRASESSGDAPERSRGAPGWTGCAPDSPRCAPQGEGLILLPHGGRGSRWVAPPGSILAALGPAAMVWEQAVLEGLPEKA